MYTNTIDILEDNILQRYPKTLDILLIDHTMTRAKGKKWNIKSFDVNNNIQYEIKNGKGYIIQKSFYNGKK